MSSPFGARNAVIIEQTRDKLSLILDRHPSQKVDETL